MRRLACTIGIALLILLFCPFAGAEGVSGPDDPYVMASSSSSYISPGDSLTITGAATEKPKPGVQIWVFGPKTLLCFEVPVEKDDTFSFTMPEEVTADLPYGMYYVVIQHPEYNNAFDLYWDGEKSLVSSYPEMDTVVDTFTLTGEDAGLVNIKKFASAIQDERIDDVYTKLQFVIDTPACLKDESACVVK
jgi:hypothetical protein